MMQIYFFRYTRMNKETFKLLLKKTKPYLTKSSKRAFSPEHRLIITLRFLATGDQILSLALAFRCGESTIRKVIQETCQVITQVLQPSYLCLPTKEEWKNICSGFLERLCRARRTIENTFEILSSRWRIYRKPINTHPKYVDKIIMAIRMLKETISGEW
ncbi:uncharacterized protein LOC112589377 [Harpegnathos saltator]|uniref:uncharacterized protein LOC112589377 n=1 Tax=Harpegnathos saltator TaxID=610380 RepID=UPI000DBEE32B|nr:uncharacterized protein LOC112589377 [Harpegnathos saltator]